MDHHIEYKAAPPAKRLFARALFRRKNRLSQAGDMPDLSASWKGIRVDPGHVAAYCEACAQPPSPALPPLYPYLLVSGLHMGLAVHPQFPLPALGLVHVRQHVLLRRPIAMNETLDAIAHIIQSRPVKAGLEFDISSFVSSGNEAVRESLSTYLVRGRFGDPVEQRLHGGIPPLDHPDPAFQTVWDVPSAISWKYARIAQDYNPVHLFSLWARAYGFKSAVAHGMWSAARCLSALPPLPQREPLRIDIAFKGPIFLGSRVTMRIEPGRGSYRFDAYAGDNPRPCLVGGVAVVGRDERLMPA